MKKLVFAAVAALALVSVGNVFASQQKEVKAQVVAEPVDTVAPQQPQQPAPEPAPADTAVAQQ